MRKILLRNEQDFKNYILTLTKEDIYGNEDPLDKDDLMNRFEIEFKYEDGNCYVYRPEDFNTYFEHDADILKHIDFFELYDELGQIPELELTDDFIFTKNSPLPDSYPCVLVEISQYFWSRGSGDGEVYGIDFVYLTDFEISNESV